MNLVNGLKYAVLLSFCSSVSPVSAQSPAGEGWNDILTQKEATGRFEWIESCHSYMLVDLWERMYGSLDEDDATKIAQLKTLLLEKEGNPAAYPQYLTFGKKDFTNPESWYAGTNKTQSCKAIPSTYKVLGAITSFDLPGYCLSEPTHAGFIWVKDVTIGDQHYTSGSGAYTNQFAKVFTVKRQNSYDYNLQAGYGINSPASWKMWIDYNQDGDFSDSGELIVHEYADPELGKFTVPAGAKAGYTKMRLQASYSGGTIDPCGGFFAGEIEDFVLSVE